MSLALLIRRMRLCLIIVILLAACAPAPRQSAEPLPTLASLNVNPAPIYALEGAERAARSFLEAWRMGDYAAMYDLVAFTSREATPYDTFRSFYEGAAAEMTLQDLRYTGQTLYRERDDVAVFAYDLTFETSLLGQFTDAGRLLRLVADPRAGDWRVAWSPGDIFPEMAGGARLRREVSPPNRANIYDRDGAVLADQNGRVVTVSAVKREIPSWEVCLRRLAPAVNRPAADLERIYAESAADWVMALGTLEPAAYEQFASQLEQACAARFSSRPARRYPNGTIAPHIVGYVGYPDEADLPAVLAAGFNQDSILGRSGVERAWDDTLRGRPGGRLLIVQPGSEALREVARQPSRPAESVWLTIDSDLQAQVQKIIAEAYAQNAAGYARTSNGAAAVLLDVNTGEILAMVSYPTFDVNAFAPFPSMGRAAADRIVAELQADPRRPQLNRATQGVYPLGSAMKTVSALAVADSGVYALDQKYTCTGIWKREERFTRFDWLPGGHGTLTLAGALTQSCNPYFYEVGYQMNQRQPGLLSEYMRRAGFGVPTGLRDIPESPGFIPDPEWKRRATGLEWTFSDEVNIAIGQGEVLVTPLQVARWYAAIANGGTLYRPQLVKQVAILGEAPSYVATPDPIAQVGARPEVLATLREGLCAVTTARAGTAEYQFRRYTELQKLGVCGKTGTAQDGSRADAVSHAWFAAYAPRDNPQVAVAVVVENAGEGSGVAAPIARDILLAYFFGAGD